MRKFWKKTEGFTLVELIVVIAILGILAGVGTVGYSGYVKKANLAADQQLLANLNAAFATACIENGRDANTLSASEATATLTGDDGSKTLSAITPTDYQDEFDKYYGEGGTFKVFTSLFFNDGMFAPDGVVQPAYGGGALNFALSDIANVNMSTFMNSSTIDGVGGLMGKIDEVTDFAAALVDDGAGGTGAELLQEVFDSAEFTDYFTKALLGDTSGMTQDQIDEALIEKQITMLEEMGGMENVNQLRANVAVLYAAQKAVTMDQNEVKTMISSGNAKGSILGTMNSGNIEEAFAEAALAYGMYTAYANSSYGSDAVRANSAAEALLAMDSDPKFQEYMQSAQATTDMQGYMSALNMINSSSSDSRAVYSLLVNGFSDGELISALEGALGSN